MSQHMNFLVLIASASSEGLDETALHKLWMLIGKD